MAKKGIRIRKVDPGSLGHRVGLVPGDEIVSVNGHPVPDELALRFNLAEEWVELLVRKADGAKERVQVDLSQGDSLGIEVEDFKTRTCNNDCLFCFINQLPPGVRPSLRVKDDDYRLSFLHGNYITLTNLSEPELERIIAHALSPLYVSVHATDPALRTRILRRKKADDLERKLRRLTGGGIRIHAQIVLMPGINDGDHLRRTVFDLYDLYPGVDSVAIVPLGLSDHGIARKILTPVTPAFSRETAGQVSPWQSRFRKEIERTFAYLADEFYILGGLPIPPASYYDGFAQVEDGVGMVRSFLDELDEAIASAEGGRPDLRGTLVTGRLFAPFLDKAAARIREKLSMRLQVVAADNRFMGRGVTVAGLLAGQDITAALNGCDVGDFAVIPNEATSQIDGTLLDNLTVRAISRNLGVRVYPSGRSVHDFFRLIMNL